MRALLIDDEPLARRELRRLLAAFPWVEIVGEASHVAEARERIASLQPALLFLDIRMPGGTGFDLLEQLDSSPRVIFTTAHDHYAVKAFEVNALDYLLKPVEPERLAAALEKVRSLNDQPAGPAAPMLEQVFLRDGPRWWFTPLKDVTLLEADGNGVRLHWGRLRPTLSRSLASFETRLDASRFIRANRQQILNLDFVSYVEPQPDGRLEVTLRDAGVVTVSRRQARIFRQLAGLRRAEDDSHR